MSCSCPTFMETMQSCVAYQWSSKLQSKFTYNWLESITRQVIPRMDAYVGTMLISARVTGLSCAPVSDSDQVPRGHPAPLSLYSLIRGAYPWCCPMCLKYNTN